MDWRTFCPSQSPPEPNGRLSESHAFLSRLMISRAQRHGGGTQMPDMSRFGPLGRRAVHGAVPGCDKGDQKRSIAERMICGRRGGAMTTTSTWDWDKDYEDERTIRDAWAIRFPDALCSYEGRARASERLVASHHDGQGRKPVRTLSCKCSTCVW